MKQRLSKRAGFTLIETAVTAVIMIVLAGSFIAVIGAMKRMSEAGDVRVRMQQHGTSALDAIIDDLRLSGFVDVGGNSYPFLFDDGVAGAPFEVHDHLPASTSAEQNEYDFGENREIVFLLPADGNGDDVPDIDGAGQLIWGTDEISYVLVTGPDGVNLLQRRVNAGAPRTVARHVERVTFDDTLSSAFEVPFGAVRVRLFFRMPDDTGIVHRHSVETTVRLRNG